MSRTAPGIKFRPHIAASLTIALLTAACQPSAETPELQAESCEQAFTPVSAVQGDGPVSPMLGQAVTVSGVVTMTDPGGLYIEQPGSDDADETSNGLYLSLPGSGAVAGQWVVARGKVSELGEGDASLTALSDIGDWLACDRRATIPLTIAELPLDDIQRESLESMNLHFDQALIVTNPRDSNRGDLRLSLDAILPAPTEVARPGDDARAQAEWNHLHSIDIRLDESDRAPIPAGTQVFSVHGVLGNDQRGPRLLADDSAHLRVPPQYRIELPAAGDLRIVSLNLHNYFNGDGRGGGFPTPRGAETPGGFHKQRARLAALAGELAPHVVAVMELENDGFGPFSAAADFAGDLQDATGADWVAVAPWDGPVGDDAITVGLFYRPDQVVPVGKTEVLDGPDFDGLSRKPMAQVFRDLQTGEQLLLAVNHLKSKGTCPQSGQNSNLRDGQGCWNEARTSAARAMSAWVLDLAQSRASGRALVLGDMNAYRMEDPITAIIESGLKDLTAPSGLRPNYSYIFRGEAGTLDYAFGSATLLPFIQSARIANVNSNWPPIPELPLPWLGASDHDPVLVDLRFRNAQTRD